jgi:cAMP-dependent protein kinase regulator
MAVGGKLLCLSLDRKTFKRVMGPIEDILKRNMELFYKIQAQSI